MLASVWPGRRDGCVIDLVGPVPILLNPVVLRPGKLGGQTGELPIRCHPGPAATAGRTRAEAATREPLARTENEPAGRVVNVRAKWVANVRAGRMADMPMGLAGHRAADDVRSSARRGLTSRPRCPGTAMASSPVGRVIPRAGTAPAAGPAATPGTAGPAGTSVGSGRTAPAVPAVTQQAGNAVTQQAGPAVTRPPGAAMAGRQERAVHRAAMHRTGAVSPRGQAMPCRHTSPRIARGSHPGVRVRRGSPTAPAPAPATRRAATHWAPAPATQLAATQGAATNEPAMLRALGPNRLPTPHDPDPVPETCVHVIAAFHSCRDLCLLTDSFRSVIPGPKGDPWWRSGWQAQMRHAQTQPAAEQGDERGRA